MPQENKRDEAYIYVRTFLHGYPDRHVRGCMLLCAAVIALVCYALLAVQPQYTYSYMLLPHCSALEQLLVPGTAVPPPTLAHKKTWIGIANRCKVDGTTF